MRPPSAGPSTAASCQVELRHVTAFGYSGRGTTSALSAVREGCRKLRAIPLTKMTT